MRNESNGSPPTPQQQQEQRQWQQQATRPKYWKEFCSIFLLSLFSHAFRDARVFPSLCVWKIFYDSILRYKFRSIKRLTHARQRHDVIEVGLFHRSAHILPHSNNILFFACVCLCGFHRMFSILLLSLAPALSFPIFILIYPRSESFTIFVWVLSVCELCVLVHTHGWEKWQNEPNEHSAHTSHFAFLSFFFFIRIGRVCQARVATTNGWRYVIFSLAM